MVREGDDTILKRTSISSTLQEDGETGSESDNDSSETVAGLDGQHRASTAVLGIVVLIGATESLFEIIFILLVRGGAWERGRGLAGARLRGFCGVLILRKSLSTAWLVLSALLSANICSLAVVHTPLDNVATGEVWDGLRVLLQVWGLSVTADTRVVKV